MGHFLSARWYPKHHSCRFSLDEEVGSGSSYAKIGVGHLIPALLFGWPGYSQAMPGSQVLSSAKQL